MVDSNEITIVPLEFDNPVHTEGYLHVLNNYASGPMGGGTPLAEPTIKTLIDKLRQWPGTYLLLAMHADRVVGIASCFIGFSTFRAQSLLNIHDLAVLPDYQGHGIGRRLLAGIEAHAQKLGCCKLTLEVRDDNQNGLSLYKRFGFVCEAGDWPKTLFMNKPL